MKILQMIKWIFKLWVTVLLEEVLKFENWNLMIIMIKVWELFGFSDYINHELGKLS